MGQVLHRTLDADGNVIEQHYVDVPDDPTPDPATIAANLDQLAAAIDQATNLAGVKQALLDWVQSQPT